MHNGYNCASARTNEFVTCRKRWCKLPQECLQDDGEKPRQMLNGHAFIEKRTGKMSDQDVLSVGTEDGRRPKTIRRHYGGDRDEAGSR